MPKILSAAEIAQNFDALLDEASKNGDEIIIEKNGRVIARLVPDRRDSKITLESMRGRLKIVSNATPRPIKKVSVDEFVQNCAAFVDAALKDGVVVLVEKDGQVIARIDAVGPMYGTVL